jgi:hypothetical protein
VHEVLQTGAVIVAFLIVAVGAAAAPAADPRADTPRIVSSAVDPCKSASNEDILVCGERGQKGASRFRIDPNVLSADRAANALPPKPPADASEVAQSNACVGPNACRDGVIPLVGMALAAAKAAVLAANGDDWRDAIRTHDDEYRLYKQAEERRRKDRGVKLGVGVGK